MAQQEFLWVRVLKSPYCLTRTRQEKQYVERGREERHGNRVTVDKDKREELVLIHFLGIYLSPSSHSRYLRSLERRPSSKLEIRPLPDIIRAWIEASSSRPLGCGSPVKV
jgi:hypothetical protein